VLGNKADREDLRKVPVEKVKAWCEENGQLPYYETSAKEQTNVNEAFEDATKRILKNKDFFLSSSHNKKNHKLTVGKTKEKNCC